MKKILVVASALLMVTSAQAQKKNIQSASNSLRHKEYSEALKYIDIALNDPSTKDNPKAWYYKGLIYMSMQNDPGYKLDKPFKKAIAPYLKAIELNPKFETQNINQGLLFAANNYYNEGISNYNYGNKNKSNDSLKGAYDNFSKVIDIYNAGGGKRFTSDKSFTKLAEDAVELKAFSAYYAKDVENSLPLFNEIKGRPASKNNLNVYLALLDIYKSKKDNDNILAILDEARNKYPEDANIRNEEINYYLINNQQDKLIKKLQDAIAGDPGNAVYHYHLANVYTNMAFPKDADNKPLDKPDNYEELITKAEEGFKKAIAADPENMGYNYDVGILFYNQSAEVSNEMNEVTGTSEEEDKKWNALKDDRNVLFNKSIPYLEALINNFEPKKDNLDRNDMTLYKNSLRLVRQMYTKQDMLDKAKEIKAKLDAVK